MRKNVLVLGAGGFIGSNLIKSLSPDSYTVTGFDIANSVSNSKKVKILSSGREVIEAIGPANADVVINCIGSANVQASFENPIRDFDLNVRSLLEILDELRKLKSSAKVIQLSSAAVYGNPVHSPVREDAIRSPISPYGLHKSMAEDLISSYHRNFGMRTCSLRIFSIYGPDQKKLLLWDLYQKAVSSKQKIVELSGSGDETRDYIFIDDFVRAIEKIIERAPFEGEQINIANGAEISISDLARAFVHELDPECSVRFSSKEKLGDPKRWQADIALLKSLGFNSQTTFEDGLKRTALAFMQGVQG